MANKPQPESPGASIRFGQRVLPVTDPFGVQTVCADAITEWRVFDNMVSVAFGTIVAHPEADGDGKAEVVVCARLRMPLALALDLRRVLENVGKSPVPKSETH